MNKYENMNKYEKAARAVGWVRVLDNVPGTPPIGFHLANTDDEPEGDGKDWKALCERHGIPA